LETAGDYQIKPKLIWQALRALKFGPQVNLFSNRNNHICKTYASLLKTEQQSEGNKIRERSPDKLGKDESISTSTNPVNKSSVAEVSTGNTLRSNSSPRLVRTIVESVTEEIIDKENNIKTVRESIFHIKHSLVVVRILQRILLLNVQKSKK
jgi:hypothetical protein